MPYKPNEIIYWELSNGDIWQLTPLGLGYYSVVSTNELILATSTLNQAREEVLKLGLTIKAEG